MAYLKLDRTNCEHCKFIGSIFPAPANCTDLEFLRMSSVFWYLHNYNDTVRECNQFESKKENELLPDGSESLQHVCGLQGYNPMIDPPCPACEKINNSR